MFIWTCFLKSIEAKITQHKKTPVDKERVLVTFSKHTYSYTHTLLLKMSLKKKLITISFVSFCFTIVVATLHFAVKCDIFFHKDTWSKTIIDIFPFFLFYAVDAFVILWLCVQCNGFCCCFQVFNHIIEISSGKITIPWKNPINWFNWSIHTLSYMYN